jgi:hypothetical protein
MELSVEQHQTDAAVKTALETNFPSSVASYRLPVPVLNYASLV